MTVSLALLFFSFFCRFFFFFFSSFFFEGGGGGVVGYSKHFWKCGDFCHLDLLAHPIRQLKILGQQLFLPFIIYFRNIFGFEVIAVVLNPVQFPITHSKE